MVCALTPAFSCERLDLASNSLPQTPNTRKDVIKACPSSSVLKGHRLLAAVSAWKWLLDQTTTYQIYPPRRRSHHYRVLSVCRPGCVT